MSETQSQQQHGESADAQHAHDASSSPPSKDGQDTTALRTNPTIRPTLVWMGISMVATIAVVAAILQNQQALGSADTTEIVVQVVGVIELLVLTRLAIRVFVLTRTTYEVDDSRIRRQYSLFLRNSSREVPMEMVRSSQLEQNRVQNLLGYGTIRVNQGLGGIRLENVEEPRRIQSRISTARLSTERS